MKKLLSTLGSLIIVSPITTTVVSCGDKPMPSLADNTIFDEDMTTPLGYDVSSWDSAVLVADDSKQNFLDNVNNEFVGKNLEYSQLDNLFVDSSNNNENNIAEMLANYETKATNSNANFTYDNIIKSLQFSIWDNNNGDQKIAEWNNEKSKWIFEKDEKGVDFKDLTIVAIGDENGTLPAQKVNKIDVEIEITPIKDNDLHFVGTRSNLKTGTDTTKYYSDNITKASEKVKTQAALYSQTTKSFVADKDFDYRYNVLFNFAAK